MFKRLKIIIVLCFIVMLCCLPLTKTHASSQNLLGLEQEIQNYIKPWEDNITIHYKNLVTDKGYSWNSKSEVRAASTIKLPLAIYVLKLEESGKIKLTEKLTYNSSHYYGGSGVIQKDKVGTQYTIQDLVQKAMVYSDNIAFIMLKERVGQHSFIQFMKSLGATYTYPQGRNQTSAYDLHLYAKELYQFSQKSELGEKLVQTLKNTIYNTTIPKGITGTEVAHKVGMIPNERIYNDVGLILDQQPYTLAVTTKQLQYDQSQKVIANIASIIHHYHQKMSKASISTEVKKLPLKENAYFKAKEELPIFDNSTGKLVKIGTIKAGQIFKRIRDYGNWHEIALGKKRGYVKESSNNITTMTNPTLFKSESNIGSMKLKGNAIIYDNSTKKLIPIATLQKGQIIEFTKKMENWYGVFIGGRKGYIHKKFVEEIDQTVRLTFAGDAMMDWSVKTTVNKNGADYPFVHVKKELATSDLGIVNLETAITTSTQKTPKQYNFKSDPHSLMGLKKAGFQLVSLANNHTLDYQTTGLKDTIAHLKKYKLDYIGGGLNASEAYAAKTYQLKGKTIKFLAFSRVLPDYSWVATATKPGLANGYDLSLIQKSIKNEKKNADFVFVYIHWGMETKRRPESFQRQWAKTMIDSGADGIIGSHPHVLQGFEYYKGKPIAYSLGNFLFPNYVKGDKAQTALLHLDLMGKNIMMSVSPYKIYQDQIIPQSEKERQLVWKELEKISYGNIKITNGRVSY